MKKGLLLFIFCLTTFCAFAQKIDDRKLVQFSGIVYDVDSNSVIPYTSVINQSVKGLAGSNVANYKGYFSFVVHEGDTIQFSAIGYGKSKIVIPEQVPGTSYTLLVKLKAEVINLPMVKVFPWATVEEFRKEFLTMKYADDDMEIAKKNSARQVAGAMGSTLPPDGQGYQSMSFRDNHNRLVNQNMIPSNPLLNPFAWGKFLQQIFEGDKSRSKD